MFLTWIIQGISQLSVSEWPLWNNKSEVQGYQPNGLQEWGNSAMLHLIFCLEEPWIQPWTESGSISAAC